MENPLRTLRRFAAGLLFAPLAIVATPETAPAKELPSEVWIKVISEVGPIPGIRAENIWVTCRDGDDTSNNEIVQVTNQMMNLPAKYPLIGSCLPEYNPDPSSELVFYVEPSPGVFNFKKICGPTKMSIRNVIGVVFDYEQQGSNKVTCSIVDGGPPPS